MARIEQIAKPYEKKTTQVLQPVTATAPFLSCTLLKSIVVREGEDE